MTLPYFRPNRLYWIYIQFRPQTVPFCAVLIYERVSPARAAKHVCHWARNRVIGN